MRARGAEAGPSAGDLERFALKCSVGACPRRRTSRTILRRPQGATLQLIVRCSRRAEGGAKWAGRPKGESNATEDHTYLCE